MLDGALTNRKIWTKEPLSNRNDDTELDYIGTVCSSVMIQSDTQDNLTTEVELTMSSDSTIHFFIGSICDSILACDLEETLDATRWFIGHEWPCIPTIPLNTHIFVLLNEMQPSAVCIQPIWPQMGIQYIERAALMWMFEYSTSPVCILDVELSQCDRTWLQTQGFTLLEVSS